MTESFTAETQRTMFCFIAYVMKHVFALVAGGLKPAPPRRTKPSSPRPTDMTVMRFRLYALSVSTVNPSLLLNGYATTFAWR